LDLRRRIGQDLKPVHKS